MKKYATNYPKAHYKSNQNSFTFPKVTVIGIAITSAAVVHITLHKNKVLCEPRKSRMAGYRKTSDEHLRFDWKLFWTYVRPHIWYLLAAIAVIINEKSILVMPPLKLVFREH